MKIPKTMRAMVLEAPGRPLNPTDVPIPQPDLDQVLLHVRACGVCRTDLHIVDGELTEPKLPLIPGHEVVGTVVRTGENVNQFKAGDRITVADARYCFHLPSAYDDAEAAPLLCAGFIGYRSYRLAGDNVERLGLYGFGAAAHVIAQVAAHQGKRLYAFTRPGDTEAQGFARRLGAVWADDSTKQPPEKLDAAIIFAPVGSLVVEALKATVRGGTVVCAGIHMSDIPSFPYRLLWEERIIRSVANLTRQDGEEFLKIAPKVPVKTEIQKFSLEEANDALDRLREGQIQGAAVLVMPDTA